MTNIVESKSHLTHEYSNNRNDKGNSYSSAEKPGENKLQEGSKRRVIVVSNRLPYEAEVRPDGSFHIKKSPPGGLVTAMEPILNGAHKGFWVGWPGATEKEGMEEALGTHVNGSMELGIVNISPDQKERYYNKFCNGYLWFKLHGGKLIDYIDFSCINEYPTYLAVQDKFADKIIKNAKQNDDIVLINDYHMLGVPHALRKKGSNLATGIFLHTPFNDYRDAPKEGGIDDRDVRVDLLRKMLECDLLRFQTQKDARNFLECVRLDLPEVEIESNREGTFVKIHDQDGTRRVKVDSYLISIDKGAFRELAQSDRIKEATDALRIKHPGINIFTGGRRDPTKAMDKSLRAVGLLFDARPELAEREGVTYHLVAAGSRPGVKAYDHLTTNLDSGVKELNNTYKNIRPGGVVFYNEAGLDREPLVAHYGLSEIGLHIPYADGCNLMIFEHAVTGPDHGAVIVSTGAGAIERVGPVLPDVFKVKPEDTDEQIAQKIISGIDMPKVQKEAIMKGVRDAIIPVSVWGNDMIRTIEGLKGLKKAA